MEPQKLPIQLTNYEISCPLWKFQYLLHAIQQFFQVLENLDPVEVIPSPTNDTVNLLFAWTTMEPPMDLPHFLTIRSPYRLALTEFTEQVATNILVPFGRKNDFKILIHKLTTACRTLPQSMLFLTSRLHQHSPRHDHCAFSVCSTTDCRLMLAAFCHVAADNLAFESYNRATTTLDIADENKENNSGHRRRKSGKHL